jgi:hypothetical protein
MIESGWIWTREIGSTKSAINDTEKQRTARVVLLIQLAIRCIYKDKL